MTEPRGDDEERILSVPTGGMDSDALPDDRTADPTVVTGGMDSDPITEDN
jgi:hypothetical protein